MPLSTEELLQQGELELALVSAADEVKQNPADEKIRILYIELLCISHEFEKADQQLSSLILLKPDLGLALAPWRQLTLAAQTRQDVFQLKAKPELIDEPTPSIVQALDMMVALNEGNASKVDQCIEAVNTIAAKNPLSLNGKSPMLMRDLDDVTAALFEVLGTNGKYFWIDFSQVVELNILKPERLLEVLWRKANIVLTNGTEGEVYLPAIYPTLGDSLCALGRQTEWKESGNAYRGVGLRSWLVGDDEISMDSQTELDFKNVAYLNATTNAADA